MITGQPSIPSQSVDNPFLSAPQQPPNTPNTLFIESTTNPFETKGTLKKTDSIVSCTEPGPVSLPESDVRSPTTDEFMAILERNSTVLRQASEKNQELNDTKKDETDSAAKDDVEFSDIVDAKEATEDVSVDDKEKSEFVFENTKAYDGFSASVRILEVKVPYRGLTSLFVQNLRNT